MSGWPREDLAVMDFFKTDNGPVSAFTLPADLEADTDQIRELIESEGYRPIMKPEIKLLMGSDALRKKIVQDIEPGTRLIILGTIFKEKYEEDDDLYPEDNDYFIVYLEVQPDGSLKEVKIFDYRTGGERDRRRAWDDANWIVPVIPYKR